jgi:hypothetical protein
MHGLFAIWLRGWPSDKGMHLASRVTGSVTAAVNRITFDKWTHK